MTKVVQLSDEAYDRLRGLKRTGESFSDVVLRLAPKGDLRALAGLRSKKELAAAKRLIARVDALDKPRKHGRR